MLSNVRIAAKIAVLMVIVAATGVAVAGYAAWSLRRISTGYDQIVYDEYPKRVALVRSSRFAVQIGYEAAEVVALAGTPDAAREAAATSESMYRDTKTFVEKSRADFPEQAAEMDDLLRRLEAIHATTTPVIALAMEGKQAEALAALANTHAALDGFANAMRDANVHGLALAKSHAGDIGVDAGRTGTRLLVITAVAAVLSVVVALLVSQRAVVSPLNRLRDRMKRLADGDTGAEVPGLGRRDEVGGMADAVQVFKDAALAKLALERQAEAERDAAASARESKERADREAAAEREQVVDQLAAELARLAAGDLTCQLGAEFPAAAARIREDFNRTAQRLRETMTGVAANTNALNGASGEIASAADDLSRRTEQQAATLEQTAAALDEITATVRKTAEGATQARDVVSAARADAERSGTVVAEAVAAINEIEASARKISNIIGVIDEIAFQTNLLALNAGVEAARAGDAGRGFAVVATEVRALAQRSADAAREIKALILSSTQQVDAGVARVAETGRALTRIVEQVLRIDQVVGEIAASAQEQSSGLHQVNTAVNQMDQVTQQNAAMVEQTTAAAHRLTRECSSLLGLVSEFIVAAPSSGNAKRAPHAAEERPLRRSA